MTNAKEHLENELMSTQLKPNGYLRLFRFLNDAGRYDFAEQVLKTAAFSYPSHPEINKALQRVGTTLPQKPDKKVFCIGLSRTGTHSLSHALDKLGLEGCHWKGEGGRDILDWQEIEKYDYLSDTPIAFIFETLFYAYPDACFIYTTRDKADWLKSVQNHFKWTGDFARFKAIVFREEQTANKVINNPLWGIIHRNLYANANNWEEAFDNYDRRVKAFFSSKPEAKLLCLDVDMSDRQKWRSLSAFLDYGFVPLTPFPRKNIKLVEFEEKRELLDSAMNRDELLLSKLKPVFIKANPKDYVFAAKPKEQDLVLFEPKGSEGHYALARTHGIRKPVELLAVENGYMSFDFSRPYSYRYYIFNADGGYLEACSQGDMPFLREDYSTVDKNISFLGDRFTGFNVCHLLLDKLPRYFDFASIEAMDGYLLFSVNSYVERAASLLGIRLYELSQDKTFLTVKFKKLYLSSGSSYTFAHPGQNINANVKTLISCLKAAVANEPGPGLKRIYIDRQASASRRVINFSDVEAYLTSRGFAIVRLEELSFEEQVRLVADAEWVIGVHGAGLANIAFCNPGTKILEILPPLSATAAYYKIACGFDLNYQCLLAEDLEIVTPDYKTWKHDPKKYNRRNVFIDIAKLNQAIDRLMD